MLIEKFQMGFGKNEFWQAGITGAGTGISRFGLRGLCIRRIAGRDFGRHVDIERRIALIFLDS